MSVTVSAGERLGVLGINGTGKSTRLSVIVGMREPESEIVRRRRDVIVATVGEITNYLPPVARQSAGGDVSAKRLLKASASVTWWGVRRLSRRVASESGSPSFKLVSPKLTFLNSMSREII